MVNVGHYELPCGLTVKDLGIITLEDTECVIEQKNYKDHQFSCVPCTIQWNDIQTKKDHRARSSPTECDS